MTLDQTPVSWLEKLAARPAVRNAAALTVSRLVTLVSGLIVTAWLGRVLGPKNYGYIGFALAVLSNFGFFVALGLETLGARDVARFPRRTRALAAQIVSLRLVLAALALLGLGLLLAALDKPTVIKLVIAIHGGWLVAIALNLDFVYQGHARMGLVALREIAVSLLTLIGVVVLVRDSSQVVLASAVTIGAMVAGALLIVQRCRRDFAAPSLRWNPRIWRILVRAAVPIAIVGALGTFYRNLDVVMLGLMRNAVDVGLYTAAFKFFMTGLAPTMILVAVFTPTLAAADRDDDARGAALARFLTAMTAAMAPVAAIGIVFAGDLIGFLFGPTYMGADGVVRLLMATAWMACLHFCFSYPLLMWHRQSQVIPPLALATVMNFGLNLALIPTFGIEGAAAGTLIAETVLALAYAFLQRGRIRAAPVVSMLVHGALALAAAALARPIVAMVGSAWLPAPWHLLLGPAVAAVLYAVVAGPWWLHRLSRGMA